MNVYGVEMNPNGCGVCRHYLHDGAFEPESVAVWLASLKMGEVAIDVGAYTGLYSLIAAQVGCKAVAFEPNPFVFKRLVENVAKNPFPVDCRNVALDDKDGESDFWVKFEMTSAGRMQERNGATKIRVQTQRLVEPRRVCAIKIDVEGAELRVLRGAIAILKRDKPVVIAEALNPKQAKALTDFMSPMGYTVTTADRRNLVFRP